MAYYNVMRFTNTTHVITVEADSEDEARAKAELIPTNSDECVFVDAESYDILPDPNAWKSEVSE